jgi:hypothetical protein
MSAFPKERYRTFQLNIIQLLQYLVTPRHQMNYLPTKNKISCISIFFPFRASSFLNLRHPDRIDEDEILFETT